MNKSLLTKQFAPLIVLAGIFLCSILQSQHASAQGCVAVRHMSTCAIGDSHYGVNLGAGQWQISTGYRWLYSNRHFRGSHEEKERKEQHTEVINNTHSLDISLSYGVTDRFSVSLAAPISYTDRSSLYEHDRVNRYHTQSSGLGDIRLTGNLWVLSPKKHTNGNILLGLGVKAPSGNYNVQDEFHRPEGIERRPVDQSIQLGDGGWGIILEMQAYKKVFNNTYVYANGFYLINPRGTNGTKTFRQDSLEVNAIRSVMSVADQYMARAGFTYALLPTRGLSVSLGGRIEGVPVYDLIGDSNGFRRPGYAASIEPGLNYMIGQNNFSLNAPVSVVRNRPRNVPEARMGERGGDAAFADFLILLSYTRRF